MRLITLEKWHKRSDNDVAKHCFVTQPFVSKLRGELSYNGYKIESSDRLVERSGTVYTQNTANIGRSPVQVLEPELETVEEDEEPYISPVYQAPVYQTPIYRPPVQQPTSQTYTPPVRSSATLARGKERLYGQEQKQE